MCHKPNYKGTMPEIRNNVDQKQLTTPNINTYVKLIINLFKYIAKIHLEKNQ